MFVVLHLESTSDDFSAEPSLPGVYSLEPTQARDLAGADENVPLRNSRCSVPHDTVTFEPTIAIISSMTATSVFQSSFYRAASRPRAAVVRLHDQHLSLLGAEAHVVCGFADRLKSAFGSYIWYLFPSL